MDDSIEYFEGDCGETIDRFRRALCRTGRQVWKDEFVP